LGCVGGRRGLLRGNNFLRRRGNGKRKKDHDRGREAMPD
jgi:hypothetical protein